MKTMISGTARGAPTFVADNQAAAVFGITALKKVMGAGFYIAKGFASSTA